MTHWKEVWFLELGYHAVIEVIGRIIIAIFVLGLAGLHDDEIAFTRGVGTVIGLIVFLWTLKPLVVQKWVRK